MSDERRGTDEHVGTGLGYQDLYEPEDERWDPRWQLRDWLVLAIMIALTVGWSLLVFFLEPGIR